MKGNQAQRKSETFQYGEGKDHAAAKSRLINILMDNGYEVFPEAIFDVEFDFRSQDDTELKHARYYHQFDVYAKKQNSNGLTSEILIECDGQSHDSEVQKGKDATAANYARFFLPDARFERIHISFIIGSKKFPDKDLIDFYRLK